MKKCSELEGNLHEYLQVGDIVDEGFVDHFINTLPPATMNSEMIQMGEPYSHVDGKGTYPTIIRTSDGWKYAGNCHRGKLEDLTNRMD